jgi:hypothetical protein
MQVLLRLVVILLLVVVVRTYLTSEAYLIPSVRPRIRLGAEDNMKKTFVIVAVVASIVGLAQAASAQPWCDMQGWWLNRGEKSPSAAALLDLVPMPVALGHFYAGDWQGGLLFSAAETLLGATMVGVALYEPPRPNFYMGPMFSTWSDTGKTIFISAVLSYIGLKFWSAYDAAVRADEYNAKLRTVEVRPFLDGDSVGMAFSGKF